MKNKMMRIASVLLVAALITTCAISGTFAKYVTKVEGTDKARVAKWGIVLTVDGNAFAEKYAATDAKYLDAEGKFSVVSSVEGEKVVAPGTNSKLVNDNYVATVKGTPEVATRYTLEGKVTDIVLPAGTYTDYTHLVQADDGTWGYTDKFTLAKDYAPVKWNLVISGKGKTINLADELVANLGQYLAAAQAYGFSADGCSFIDAIAIMEKVAGTPAFTEAVENILKNVVTGGRNFAIEANKEAGTFKLSYDFDPNKEMDFEFALTWAWAFENGEEIKDDEGNGTGIFEFDAADTFLGNLVAGAIEVADTSEGAEEGATRPAKDEDFGASTTLDATLKATAVQID
jgi:hypothetical protein